MSKILIKNAKAIVTCDGEDRVYRDSDILIDGPAIVQIGQDLEAEGAEIIDARGKFVFLLCCCQRIRSSVLFNVSHNGRQLLEVVRAYV